MAALKKTASALRTSKSGFRNYGVQVGDMFGPNGHTNNKDEAWIEITELSDDHAIVSRHSGDGDWEKAAPSITVTSSAYIKTAK